MDSTRKPRSGIGNNLPQSSGFRRGRIVFFIGPKEDSAAPPVGGFGPEKESDPWVEFTAKNESKRWPPGSFGEQAVLFREARRFTELVLFQVRHLPQPMLRSVWDAMPSAQRVEYLAQHELDIAYMSTKIGDETYVEFMHFAEVGKARYDSRGRRYI